MENFIISQIPWITNIPDKWRIKPTKYIMKKIKKITSSPQNQKILSLSMNGVIVRDLEAGGKMPKKFDGYQEIHSNNLLMCLFDIDVTPRCIGIVEEEGITSPAYSQFKIYDGSSTKYYYYFFLILDERKELVYFSKNLRFSLTEEDLGRIKIVHPPLAEQKRIADYLDDKCGQIDDIVADLEQKIDKLNEYKKQIVFETTTKGLDKNVEMKDSGNFLIGKIPFNYQILRYKFLLQNNDGGVWGEEPCGYDDKIVLRSTEQTVEGKWDIVDPAQRNLRGISYRKFKIVPGDLLVTKSSGSSDHIGKTTIADDFFIEHECYYSNFIQRLRVKENCDPKFYWYVMNSKIARFQFVLMQNSTIGLGNINAENINEIEVPYPPLAEQKRIADYLDDKCGQIDDIVADTKKEIEKLKAFKQSLIYEYVTGKKEVPN